MIGCGSAQPFGGRSGRRGSVVVQVAAAIFVLLGMAALSIDYGMVALARQQLQNAADAAALAGAGRLGDGGTEAAARATAVEVAACNQCLKRSVTLRSDIDIQIGAWDAATKSLVPPEDTRGSTVVRVTAQRTRDVSDGPIPLAFSRVFGFNYASLKVSAAAGVLSSPGGRKPLEMIVAQDASNSFTEEWEDAVDADWDLYGFINGQCLSSDRIGYVGFHETLKMTSRRYYYKVNGDWRYDYMPTYKRLSSLDVDHDGLPQGWDNHYDIIADDDPSGYTNPSVALDWAIDEFIAHGHADLSQQSIVVVSDGMPYGNTSYLTSKYRRDTIAQADRAAALGIRIHTVTLTNEAYGDYGWAGSDFEFNKNLVRNGGYALRTHDAHQLGELLLQVGTLDVGKPRLLL